MLLMVEQEPGAVGRSFSASPATLRVSPWRARGAGADGSSSGDGSGVDAERVRAAGRGGGPVGATFSRPPRRSRSLFRHRPCCTALTKRMTGLRQDEGRCMDMVRRIIGTKGLRVKIVLTLSRPTAGRQW